MCRVIWRTTGQAYLASELTETVYAYENQKLKWLHNYRSAGRDGDLVNRRSGSRRIAIDGLAKHARRAFAVAGINFGIRHYRFDARQYSCGHRVDCYGSGADCATNQMAASDLNRWRTLLDNYLPAGNGQVESLDLGGTTQVTVTVEWIDPYSAESGNEQLILMSELTQ